MKNITVTVSDELYHAARIKAAEKHTTVSAIVRDHLQELVSAPKDDSLRALFEEYDRDRAGKRFHMENNLTREELHDRSNFR